MAKFALYIGTYTQGWACAEKNDCTSAGIYRSCFDDELGVFSAPELAAPSANPSYLAIHPNGLQLFGVSELADYAGRVTGAVSSYRIEPTGALTQVSQVASEGADPCHVSVDRSGRFVFVANYSGGSVASYRIAGDGSLIHADTKLHSGSGPHPNQGGPHAHFIAEAESDGRLYVADLGIDRVLAYELDRESGKLTLAAAGGGQVVRGGGPRHLAFHPNRRHVYANDELSSQVTVFDHDVATGALSELQTVSTLPPDYAGKNDTAAIALSRDGKFLYVSNRGHNSVAVFGVDASSGRLTLKENVASGGDWPRDFKLDPSGKFLLVEHQKSDNIVVFRLDPRSGTPVATGHELQVSKPVNIAFLPPR